MAVTAAATEAASGSLKCKTWVLKVSIHCQGCKREVKKALQKLEGVYQISIDSQQHKVTVTGNINSEALLSKLTKIGKHAELLPDNSPGKPLKPEKGERQNVQRAPSGELVSNNSNGGQRSTKVNFAAAQASDNTCRKTATSPKNGNPNGKATAKIDKESNAVSGGDKGSGQACHGGGASGSNNKGKGQKGNTQKKGNVVTLPSTVSMNPQKGTKEGFEEIDCSPKGNQSQITIPNPTNAEPVASQEITLSYNSTHYSGGRVDDLYHQYIPPQSAVYTDADQLKTMQGHLVQEQVQERSSSMNSFDIFSEENANGCSIM